MRQMLNLALSERGAARAQLTALAMTLAGAALGIWLWRASGADGPAALTAHVGLGLAVVGLSILQGLAVALRPKPKHRLRRAPAPRTALRPSLREICTGSRLRACACTLRASRAAEDGTRDMAGNAWAILGLRVIRGARGQVDVEPVPLVGGPRGAAGCVRQRACRLRAGTAACLVLLGPGAHLGHHLARGRRQDGAQCATPAPRRGPGQHRRPAGAAGAGAVHDRRRQGERRAVMRVHVWRNADTHWTLVATITSWQIAAVPRRR